MQAIASVTFPFFALIFIGWLAARRGLLPAAAIPGLNAFVLFFALPCMLLRFGMQTPLLELLHPVMASVYLLTALGMVALACVQARSARGGRHGWKDSAFGALVAAFPNSGFIGVPLLVALFGPAAAGPVICSILIDMVITSSLCLGLSQLQRQPPSGAGPIPPSHPLATAGLALRSAFSNPLPWSIALGGLLGALGWTLPGPVAGVVRLLADAASPVALFTIGAVLWRSTPAAPSEPGVPRLLHWRHLAAPLGAALPVALLKLLIHPLLVAGLGGAAMAAGAPLSRFQWGVLVLTAALPSASNVSLLAERHRADNGRVARIILVSTVLAFGSFTTLAWWLEPLR